MSGSTKLYVGVLVLAGLGGAIYMAQKKDKEIGNAQTTAAEMPEIKAPDDIDKVSIQNADKQEIVLEKKGETWEMTKPVAAPANQTNVDQVIKNLKDLKAKEVIAPAPTEDSKKDYDFTKEKQVHVVTWKGADKKTDITFGASGARGQMAMVEGKPAIYAISGYSSYLYTRDVKGFRETEIFKFDDANANQLTIEKTGADKKVTVLSFTKDGDKWAGTVNGKPIDRYDEEKVKDAVRAFKALTADDFGDGKTTAETGLDEPESKVTVKLKDGAGTYSFKVGGVSTGTNRWAMKDGSPTIYAIPSYTADWATADVTKFQRAADAGAPKDGGGAAPTAAPDPHGGDPHGGDPHGGDPHGH
ncbi:MAG: DUF4340 domain-containing protein [Labilithrix sp.]|nr:DUF4340 domain-containing protein [Labilithrix sp.]MCW5809913.1 DUF4340 domain-containing protein [Labilithrix sp.]